MKKSKKGRIILSGCIIVIIGLLLITLYQSKFCLEVSTYQIPSSKIENSIRIVQLTDLHLSQFGKQNEQLIDKVEQQNPDLIFLTGDLMNSYEKDPSVALTLIRGLAPIAPVYLSLGNHEIEYMENDSGDLITSFSNAGAHVLEFSYEDVEINDQTLRIGGVYGYCLPKEALKTGEAKEKECTFLENFQNTQNATLLLCHMPVSWMDYGSLDAWDIDVVFAGHAHGGQVRIPFLGGLIAPDQGWFVGREEGLYFSADHKKTLVLSRGLGTSGVIPRLNNIPQVMVIDLIPAQEESD